MKLEELKKCFEEENTKELEFEGFCYDCKKALTVLAVSNGNDITITGGAIYAPKGIDKKFLKCDKCVSLDPVLRNYQPVQNYSRCVGYMRPVNDWNPGKQEEFRMRKTYSQPSLEVLTQ